jgi:hypothetical protein
MSSIPSTATHKQEKGRMNAVTQAMQVARDRQSAVFYTSPLLPGHTFRVEEITPSMAKEMLTHNVSNRSLVDRRVQQYCEAMHREEWLFEGTPIAFDSNGNLIQGQHRLYACIRANRPFVAMVIRGNDPRAFGVTDTGKPRTGGDALQHEGVPEGNMIAAASRLILNFDDGNRHMNSTYTHPQITAFVAKHYETLKLSVPMARKTMPFIPGGTGAALHFILARIDRDMADAFFESLSTGESLRKTNPILTLRNRLTLRGPGALPRPYIFAIVIKAWNAHRLGHPIHLLKWLDDESMPVPI